MTDIIKDAQKLLGGATPGPWKWEERTYKDDFECRHDWLGSAHSTALITIDSDEYSSWVEASDSDKELIAAAPELAKTVIEQAEEIERLKAEETWEYQVQVKRGDQWQFYIGESRLPTDKPGLANGFSKLEHAREFAKIEPRYPTRIVRRRVSPPEVINE